MAELTYEQLRHKTLAELREMAKGSEHEALQGYTQMNKEHLLPAICAVTRFAVRSSPRGDASGTGTLVRGEGGVVGEKLLVDTPAGTTVEAQDLFFNTPGRLKFLKTAPTELAAALRLLEGIGLAHPDIHLRVTHNGKAVLTAPSARGLRDRLGALRGFDLAARMLDVDRREGDVSVTGLIVPPQLARGNRDAITIIVNPDSASHRTSRTATSAAVAEVASW